MNKAVFIDRDGTLNADRNGYISHPQDFNLFPFAAEAVKKLNEMNFLVFIVTNQSGIARGYYSLQDLAAIHQKMHSEMAAQNAKLDDVFISPYHQDGIIEPYNIKHEDRKPGLGMFHKARKKYEFSLKNSFMIGDKYSDIIFGRKAGLKTILVRTGNGNHEFLEKRKNWEQKPHYIVKDLLCAVNLIESLR